MEKKEKQIRRWISDGVEFKVEWFDNNQGNRRLRLIDAMTGEVVEDYQGYGGREEMPLLRIKGRLEKEIKEAFYEEHKDAFSRCKSTKDVEAVLLSSEVRLPNIMTPLMLFRLINGSNKKAHDTRIKNNTDENGDYHTRYVKNGQLYEVTYHANGDVSMDVDGNKIY